MRPAVDSISFLNLCTYVRTYVKVTPLIIGGKKVIRGTGNKTVEGLCMCVHTYVHTSKVMYNISAEISPSDHKYVRTHIHTYARTYIHTHCVDYLLQRWNLSHYICTYVQNIMYLRVLI